MAAAAKRTAHKIAIFQQIHNKKAEKKQAEQQQIHTKRGRRRLATQTGIKQKLRTAQEKQQNIQVAEREWERGRWRARLSIDSTAAKASLRRHHQLR